MRYRTLVAFALFAGLAFCGCAKTDPMEATSGDFLATIHDGKLDDAYKMTSPSLQKVTNQDQFKSFIATLGLADYRSVRWFGHVQTDSTGYVEGQIVRKDSGTIPVKVHLAQDKGTWKVSGMERLPGFGLAGNISQQFPPDAVVRQLVAAWITLLDRAIKTKDFTEFYSNMSSLGQRTTSKDALAKGFEKFIENQINMAAALNSNAIVTPYLSSDVPNQPRVLFVESTFQTEPAILHLNMKFTMEGANWKLLSLTANF